MIPTPEEAWALLCQYNQGEFHQKHARIVGDVLRWYAQQLGYGEEADFWEAVGILHDLDFEQWPERHCIKEQELLREHGVDGPHRLGGADEALRQRQRHGGQVRQKEVQGQKVCRRLLPPRDRARRGHAGLGAGHPHRPHPSGHARQLRGGLSAAPIEK